MLGIVGADSLDDQVFSSDIGFGNEIDVTLDCDLRCPETLDQHAAGIPRDLSGEVKHADSSFLRCWLVDVASFLPRPAELPGPVCPSKPMNDRQEVLCTHAECSFRT